jgi:hypothetical protein
MCPQPELGTAMFGLICAFLAGGALTMIIAVCAIDWWKTNTK